MLALHRTDVNALNDAARAKLDAEGAVDDWPLYVLGRPYATGDRIISLRNDARFGLINGQRGTITNTGPDGFHVHFEREPRPRTVPFAYFEAGHVNHAYAMTVHKAQGLTCDRAYILASPDLYAEAGYTALSRGRHENRLYLTTDQEPGVEHHGAIEDDDPFDGIRAALRRSEREKLATEHLDRLFAGVATRDQPSPDTPHHDLPERDDGIDLGWEGRSRDCDAFCWSPRLRSMLRESREVAPCATV